MVGQVREMFQVGEKTTTKERGRAWADRRQKESAVQFWDSEEKRASIEHGAKRQVPWQSELGNGRLEWYAFSAGGSEALTLVLPLSIVHGDD
jgi:hypothetical protein